jgi:hypothetical protein
MPNACFDFYIIRTKKSCKKVKPLMGRGLY